MNKRLALFAFLLVVALAPLLRAQQIGPSPGGGSAIGLTTSGTTGAATLSGSTVNIPTYLSGSGSANLSNILGGTPQLPHWNQALARVMSGKGNARILCVGDSTFMGLYSTNTMTGNMGPLSACGQLTNVFNGAGIFASFQGFIGDGSGIGSGRDHFDNRISIGSGWTTNQSTSLSLGGTFFSNSTTTSPISLTPTQAVDTFVIWYPTIASGGGTLNYNVDGGSNTGISLTTTAASFASTKVSTTPGVHTLNVSRASGGTFFDAIEAYDSAIPQVIIDNAGWNGATTGNWVASTGSPWDPAAACGTFGADLVIINLQLNDMDTGVSLSTYKSNLQSLISSCQSGGNTDVLLMTSNHLNPSDATDPTSEATQLTYANVVRTVAATTSNSSYVTGVPVVDEFSNLVSYAFELNDLNAVFDNGAWPYDVHMNYNGYGIMARDIGNVLIPAGGNQGANFSGVSVLPTTNTGVGPGIYSYSANTLDATTSGGNSALHMTSTYSVGVGGNLSPATALDVNGLITGGSHDAFSADRVKLDLSSSTGLGSAFFDFPSGGIFGMYEVSILGTNDVYFQDLPATAAGYAVFEGYWPSNANGAGLVFSTGDNSNNSTAPIILRPNRSETARFPAGGGLAIGQTSLVSSTLLTVNGSINQATEKSCSTGLTTDSNGTINGCVASDRSLKRDIQALQFDPTLIDRLRPVSYLWNDTAKYDDKRHGGFVAQEVEAVDPNAVKSAGNGLLGIDNSALEGAIVLDLQNVHAQILGQQREISSVAPGITPYQRCVSWLPVLCEVR